MQCSTVVPSCNFKCVQLCACGTPILTTIRSEALSTVTARDERILGTKEYPNRKANVLAYLLELVPSCDSLLEITCIQAKSCEIPQTICQPTSQCSPSMFPGSKNAIDMSQPGPMYNQSVYHENLMFVNSLTSHSDRVPCSGGATSLLWFSERIGWHHRCRQHDIVDMIYIHGIVMGHAASLAVKQIPRSFFGSQACLHCSSSSSVT